MPRQKITTFLWFDGNAEEAVNFYISVFRDGQITRVTRYGHGAPMPSGAIMTIEFRLAGVEFIALNGGPYFKFNEAISLSVDCATQQEVDYYWEKLSTGGNEQCGWLKDRYGLSWQIVPANLSEMVADPDPAKSNRVMQALLQMKKLDMAKLQAAYEGK